MIISKEGHIAFLDYLACSIENFLPSTGFFELGTVYHGLSRVALRRRFVSAQPSRRPNSPAPTAGTSFFVVFLLPIPFYHQLQDQQTIFAKMRSLALQNTALRRAVLAKPPTLLPSLFIRAASSVSQRPHSDFVSFPGALKSAFTNNLDFQNPQTWTALPTYRVVDQNGDVVDPSFEADIPEEKIVKLYTDMLYISILDVIMFDAQRQGRLSFYMVSAGEEAVPIGSSSVLEKEDVIFCQYREQGTYRERGFTTKDFMAQLFANKHDPGKARNMPVHYGSKELNIVSTVACQVLEMH